VKCCLYDLRMYLTHVDALAGSSRKSASELRGRFVKAEMAVREYERCVSERLLRPDEVYDQQVLVFSELADVMNRYLFLTGEYRRI
jgi:hypothetical protein